MNNSEDNFAAIDKCEQEIRDLDAKIDKAKEEQAKERSAQFLLNYELSQINGFKNQLKREIRQLESEQARLTGDNQRISSQLKRMKNYFGLISAMQTDRKAEWMQNLMGELNGLDFTLEEYENEPRSVDTFTQFAR